MAKKGGVANIKAVINAIEKTAHKHTKHMAIGLFKGGLLLQRESQKLTPIQHGHLRASAGTKAEGAGKDISVLVFYSAEYALWVHEDLEAAHGEDFNAKYAKEIANAGPNDKYYFNRGTNQQAKFLETALTENQHKIAKIIKNEMRLG